MTENCLQVFLLFLAPAAYAFVTGNNNDKKAVNFIVQYHTSKGEHTMFYKINKMYAKKLKNRPKKKKTELKSVAVVLFVEVSL